MALEPVKSFTPFIKAALLEKGQTIKGYYTGTWSSELYPDRKNIKLVLKEPQTFKTHKKVGDTLEIENISLQKGSEIILQAGGTLKYFFDDNHPQNVLFHFIYQGMAPMKSGPAKGKDMHRFEVLRDLDDKLEANTLAEDDLQF